MSTEADTPPLEPGEVPYGDPDLTLMDWDPAEWVYPETFGEEV